MQQNDGGQQQEGHITTTPPSIAALGAITTSHPAVTQLRVTGRLPVVTASPAVGVVSPGQQAVISTVASARPVAMTPQAVMVPTQTVSRLLSPSTSLSNTVQIPATLNVLQRQLSSPGVVGLSAVSAQDLQQVLQQASQQSITFLTATEAVAEPQQRPRLARPLSFSHSSSSLQAVSSVSATGATIHHHGQSPVRGAVPVMAAALSHSNLQHSLLGMNLNPQQQQLGATHRRVVSAAAATTTTTTTAAIAVMPAANISAQSRTVSEVRAPSGQPPSLRTASGAPPRKKMRLEEKAPPNAEVASYRKQLVDMKHKQMKELKSEYFENLTEMFFLQNGQNLMDYHAWKKRPTPQLVSFLKSGKLDSDEEEDVLQVKEINSEVKVLTNPGSNVPLATPVAISTTLPPMVSALSQQVVAPSAQTASAGSATTTLSTSASVPSTSPSTTSSSQLHQQLAKTPDSKTTPIKGPTPTVKVKSPPQSPNQRQHTRQHSLSSVYDNLSGSSQEVIVERAKQEAQVIQRVAELRKEGLWSSKRLPRVQEPPRQKAHWDYLLEEMTWLAADFVQERKWKKAAARKVARMVSNYFKEQEQKELKAEKEEASKLKRIASHMAKMVKEFWTNIEKVVQYKQQMRLDEKKKRALDLHLNFIVDQTEKYSTWLTEGLQAASSVNGSVSTSPSHSSEGDDFEPSSNSSDDEETIQKEEDETEDNDADKHELEELQKEGDLPLDELLKTLPQEVLDAPAPLLPPLPEGLEDIEDEKEEESKSGEKEEKVGSDKEGSDKEFAGTEEEAVDIEDTIDEEEKDNKRDYTAELQELADEGEMSIEALAAKYAGAYDSDFELPQDSSSEENDDDDDDDDDEDTTDSDEFEIETGSSSEEEEEEKIDNEDKKTESVGLEALMKPQEDSQASTPSTSQSTQPPKVVKSEEKDEEIDDIAAQALSLQPKGYTLETTEVKTKVPFLLKHTLREYQHVGLDWLATMHDKHLNGILADEMGLGKTIQTIALLAHLACEKSTWGPHLIVVPTSVMLNWEMELKKWCPSFKILTYYGTQKERKLKRQGWTKTNAFHVCITSYKLVVQDHQAFRRKKWKYLILDEAQNIKNFKSQRWQMLLNFSSQRRLLLTGTPLQNSLMELWSLMHFLMPNVFQSHRDFKEWFSNPLTGMIEGSQEYNESLIKRLHKVLRPFLLRRLKNEVEKQMPQKYEHVVMCRLSKRQRFLYDDFMAQAKTKETLAAGHYMSVINILMQLRKVCNHPNLFDPRPVVSPLYTQGLTYSTASIVTKALIRDPMEEVDMRTLFPNLVEMERDLPAFVAHRVKQLNTPAPLIEEIDYQPDPPPRPPPGQLKPGVLQVPAILQASGRASPSPQSRPRSPADVVKTTVVRSATPPVTGIKVVAGQPSVSSTLSSSSSAPSLASIPSTGNLITSAAAVVTTQVRTSSGQTLLLTSAARSTGSSTLVLTSSTPSSLSTTPSTISTPLTSTLQAKVLPQPAQGTSSSSGSVLPSQPITVQIQHTQQGTRLMIPTGQLSQLPGNLFQIVQTSSGQQFIATSTPTSSISGQVSAVLPVTSTASNTVNGPSTLTTVAATCGQGLVTTAISQLKTLTALSSTASTASTTSTPTSTPASITTPASSSMSTSSTLAPSSSTSSSISSISSSFSSSVVTLSSSKPVMRVSPMVASTSSAAETSSTTTTTSSLPAAMVSSVVSTLKSVMSPKKRSELFLESVYEKRKHRRREKLKRLARVNAHHCTQTPVYGPDLLHTLTSDVCSKCQRERHWLRAGYANCRGIHCEDLKLSRDYWHETSHLADMIHTPEQYLTQLQDILNRFAFCIPSVISPGVQLRVAHPDPSHNLQINRLDHDLREHLRPVTTSLNHVHMRMSIHFPELRLIQYDCGKLQTLDVLLRRLKSGSHRVLIFTQMTKMLDVLEAFLNYHGHRYLRLDGTTKVEQRQALMDRFNADKRIFCFILSTRSGGIGVNLTGADTVVFYDSDWNPTMDAQAQDRCHRIGQTRDVHIYRLISEMTVEENILKKANQKRLLGDLAIEGGNFTTAFFKEQTIKDLFAQPSGLKALTEEKKEKEAKEPSEENMVVEEGPPAAKKTAGKDKEANIVAAFEQALCKAEDETDAIAANQVKAEQKAELADFDESIPWDEKEAEARKEEEEMSRAEMELAMLDKELSPIERYAVVMVEAQMEDEVMEELKMAEEDIENSKKDWELTRLKALKEEEERRAKMEEDEMLYTYLRDDSQIFINGVEGGEMPLWAPPTPPQDDNDVYVDQTMLFLHEGTIMTESQLPPVYVRKDHRKPRIETITICDPARKQKQRKEEAPRVPRSLFDRPNSALVKMRREQKMQRLKAAGLGISQKAAVRPNTLPTPLSHKTPATEQSEGHPEWLIHEDWALLQAVSDCCHSPLNMMGYQNGHILNWDLVADVVNGVSRTHRSIKQCRARYENVIIPREEGRILYDVSPRKQKKNKSTYKTKNNRPMKTSQLFTQDNSSSISLLYSLRFDSVKCMALKRPAPVRQTLNNPTLKNPKHLAVLQENNINYDQPLNPQQVAAIRAERIQREKKANTAGAAATEASQRAAQAGTVGAERVGQAVVQAVGAVAASAPTVAQAVTGQQLHSLVSAANPTTIIQAGTVASRAAVPQGLTAVSIARTLAATGNIVHFFTKQAVTGSLGRGRVQVHDIATVPGTVTGAQVAAQAARATLQPTASASANITHKMAIAGPSALAGGKSTVHQQLAKGLTTQQINLLRPIMRSQPPGTATQAQQLGQKVRFTTKQALVRTVPGLTDEQLKALKVRQLQNKAQGGQQVKLQATQILQGQVQQVGQSGTASAAPVTLVKSVAAPAGAIPVNINVTMGQAQQKTALPSRGATVSQLQQQRMQLLQQQRKGVPIQQSQRVTALTGGVRGNQIPLIIPQKTQLTGQLLHQFVKQQQIISTSQPAIISVTQAQTLAKMSHSTPITLSAAAASPITVAQVAAASSAGVSGTQTHTPVATINMASVSAATHATVVKTATLASVEPSQQGTASVQKMATIAQSLVTPQPLHITSSALQSAQAATLVGAGGTQHRILTATPTTLPQATAVVVSTTALAQPSASATLVQQQPAQQLVTASPSPMATVVTQTQSPQPPHTSQPSPVQLTVQQQQQLQKGSPYTMRTRNTPKHT